MEGVVRIYSLSLPAQRREVCKRTSFEAESSNILTILAQDSTIELSCPAFSINRSMCSSLSWRQTSRWGLCSSVFKRAFSNEYLWDKSHII